MAAMWQCLVLFSAAVISVDAFCGPPPELYHFTYWPEEYIAKFAVLEYNTRTNDAYLYKIIGAPVFHKSPSSGNFDYVDIKLGRTSCQKTKDADYEQVDSCMLLQTPGLTQVLKCHFEMEANRCRGYDFRKFICNPTDQ